MPTITLETLIDAPPETCFDLIRDIRIQSETTSHINKKEPIGLGQTVTFEGKLFGLRQRLTVQVIEFDRPRRFVDAMVNGAFRSFVHIHDFESRNDRTLMRDTLIWTSPLGLLGVLADSLFLKRHLKDLVQTRNAKLKQIAEGS
jgi:ligand-binding SRPBCC domain-containing protein